ncbi:MAG: hypothetical protein AAGJ18_08700 [Bacteroidota bacterium]
MSSYTSDYNAPYTQLNFRDISNKSDKKLRAYQAFLRMSPNFQAFFWIRKPNAQKPTHITNLKPTLGHHKASIANHLHLIPRAYQKLYSQLFEAFDYYCTSGSLGSGIDKFTFVVFLPYKTIDNQYSYIRQTNTIHDYNQNNQVLSYLSWHDLVRPYRGEPLTFQIYMHQGSRFYELEAAIKRQANYDSFFPFSPKEIDILKVYLNEPNLKAREVAKALELELTTVYTHNRNILGKANQHFSRPFRTMTQLADFLGIYEIFSTST